MYLIFMDGAGNTGADLTHPTSTVHYLLGLAVPSDNARALEDAVSEVLSSRFAAASRVPGFECKGSDLYRGEGPCARMAPEHRLALYGELAALVARFDVEVIWRGIDKRALAAQYARPMHPHRLAFLYFAEAAERFLRERKHFGLLISDEEKSVEQQVIEDLPRYKELGTGFGHSPIDLTRIIDNVHWVKSHNSRLLQLADNCTFLCQRHHRDIGKTTRQAAAIHALWRVVGQCVWSGKIWP